MLDEQDVYICFRTVQCTILNRQYRHPKDWDSHFQQKMRPEQREALRKMVRYLATTWSNVDLEKYFFVGFELWKTFSYHQFFNTQVINLYIQKEKNYKRKCTSIKKDILTSAIYIKKLMIQMNIFTLNDICKEYIGFRSLVADLYIKNNISQHFFGYVLYKKYISKSVFEDDQIQEIVQKWNVLRNEVIDNLDFLLKIEKDINNLKK